MILDPGVVEPGVVGHEVEHQAEISRAQPLAQTGEGGVSAEVAMDGVAGDREARARDVVVREVG
jgi:hypothetical protein